MKKRILVAALISACTLAGPAAAYYQSSYQASGNQGRGAQSSYNAQGTISFDARISQLQTRLEAGVRSGAIGRPEATRLRSELTELRRLSDQNRRERGAQQQQAELQQRLVSVRQQIRTADRGAYDRYERQDEWADYDRGNPGFQSPARGQAFNNDARITQLRARLDAGVRGGTIDRRQAASLRQEIDQLARLERQYSRSRATPQQQAEVQQGIRTIRQQLRTADRGSYDRYEQGGDWAEYDAGYGRGSANETPQACAPRTGIGGIIGGLLGVGDDCAGLRIGQRAGTDLYGVPTQYRNQYRDSGTAYYRSDGRQIYQIDSRTNTVVRIHPM